MKHRLFLAIDLPQSLHTPLTKLQTDLQKLGSGVEWEKPERIHLVLNYLGKVEHASLSALQGSFFAISRHFQPFTLTLQFLETLYQRHEKSLIYLSPTGQMDALKAVQREFAKTIAHEFKIPQPIRFLPHFTIGKIVKIDPVFTKQVIDKIDNYNFAGLSELKVTHLTMYETLKSQKGEVYQVFQTFPLGDVLSQTQLIKKLESEHAEIREFLAENQNKNIKDSILLDIKQLQQRILIIDPEFNISIQSSKTTLEQALVDWEIAFQTLLTKIRALSPQQYLQLANSIDGTTSNA